jgi:hypothetical protein
MTGWPVVPRRSQAYLGNTNLCNKILSISYESIPEMLE